MWVAGDIEAQALDDVVTGDIDAVVHCAARIPGAANSDDACASSNLRIDARVLRFCGVRRIPAIFCSSASVYQSRKDGIWVDERSPVQPGSAYAAAKLESEKRFLDLPAGAAVFRITSPYGPEQRTENVIRRFCRAATAGHIEVWGTGSREQDFIHVDDVASAVVTGVGAERVPHGVCLVAAGQPTTMIELARLTLRAAGVIAEPILCAHLDAEDGRTSRYDISKARTFLGWRPQISLAAGLASCLLAWRGDD